MAAGQKNGKRRDSHTRFGIMEGPHSLNLVVPRCVIFFFGLETVLKRNDRASVLPRKDKTKLQSKLEKT